MIMATYLAPTAHRLYRDFMSPMDILNEAENFLKTKGRNKHLSSLQS